jgi:hypothetical protein
LVKINEVVAKMDPAIRLATFDLLVSRYVTKQAPSVASPKGNAEAPVKEAAAPADTADIAAFIEPLDTKKPTENVEALVAWLYSQHGTYPVSAKEIQELADACGLIVPNRSDNTMRNAKSNGKGLFQQQGKGWKLTVSGELYMKEKFGVKKGNKPQPKE